MESGSRSIEMRPLVACILMLLILFLPGCSTRKPLYQWGEYEDLVYDMYVKPGEADPATQVAKLTEDIQKMHDAGYQAPPGIHAHLGYMQYLQGNAGVAITEFEIEKTLYPESSVFIDGLIRRLGK